MVSVDLTLPSKRKGPTVAGDAPPRGVGLAEHTPQQKSGAKKRARNNEAWEKLSPGLLEDGAPAEPDEASLEMALALAKQQQPEQSGSSHGGWVRRSVRASGQTELSSRQVNDLLEVIRSNGKDAVVLKLKHWIGPDSSTWVIDAVIQALMKNDNCEALYIQNFNEGASHSGHDPGCLLYNVSYFWCLSPSRFLGDLLYSHYDLRHRNAGPAARNAYPSVASWNHMVPQHW